ncbi:hypothetical protein [Salinispora mooreana]|nr:hypothetical protein [Salinispora mooreana]
MTDAITAFVPDLPLAQHGPGPVADRRVQEHLTGRRNGPVQQFPVDRGV